MSNHANLLPMAWRRRMVRRHRIRQWSIVSALIVFMCAALSAYQYAQLTRNRSKLTRLRQTAEPLKQQVHRLGNLRAELIELQSRESLLEVFEGAGEPFLILGMVSRSGQAAPQLLIDRFELTYTRKVGTPRNQTTQVSGAAPSDQTELLLRGTTSSDQAVTQFIEAIHQYGIFDHVNLRSIQAIGDTDTMNFSVSCVYRKWQ